MESDKRDDVLKAMAFQGWSNEGSGEEEATTGRFWRISNKPSEIEEISQAFEEELGELDAVKLIGHFLVIQSVDRVDVNEYETGGALRQAYLILDEAYIEWKAKRPEQET